ncbi:hypothetical protein [Pseudolactococcus raffinolactis]|uniref:hypothetical protein n=1 Tax=Pseudolactococcus raffinolactis TaxID=1366 RepID=UPI000BB48135|nr:hypothetical protein [Lactococcus raffinolactis]ATC61394.1 hypothetical protein CMV25_05690 [Lactococcus raffinolactis]
MNYSEIFQDVIATLISGGIVFIISTILYPKVAENWEKRRQDEKEQQEMDSVSSNQEGDVIKTVVSKDYGPEGIWSSRTFYTIKEDALDSFSKIIFNVRENKNLTVELQTEDIKKSINKEIEADGKGLLRVFINGKKGSKDLYITRFGKKRLEKPLKLTRLPYSDEDSYMYEIQK